MTHSKLRIEDITILIDSREQRPLEFPYGPPDSQKKIKTEKVTLTTGDYSIKGLEKQISCERKSLPDLLGCIGGQNRDRFQKEIQRLRAFPCRLIAVEASWDEILIGQWRGQIKPNQVIGSIQGWYAYGIPFFFHPDRREISKFIANTMFIHARRCFDSLSMMIPNLKILGDP